MPLNKKQKQAFIRKVAKSVQKHAPEYDILVCSPVIAQAILESGWGESKLASKYHNYFGLKCGTLWEGESVNLETREEYSPGTETVITDNFRVYTSFDEGIKGYFDFIQLDRYHNLRGITDPEEYCRTVKEDGYATDSQYVQSLMALIEEWGLTAYDLKEKSSLALDPIEEAPAPDPDVAKEEAPAAPEDAQKEEEAPAKTAEAYLSVWRSWVGKNEVDGSFREIIDTYNSHKPLARGYEVQYTDEWCDTTVSAAAVKAGMTDLIGTECGCEAHVKIFQEKGIWIEDGTITPEPGDIILFSWRTGAQPNNSFSDHIGVVAAVRDGVITTIEGNKDEAVGYRSIPVGWGYIRGFARPEYDEAPVSQTIAGKELSDVSSGGSDISRESRWTGRVTADLLNVRTWAGMEYPNIKSWPTIMRETRIEVCDEVRAADGRLWYYIRIAGSVYGFACADFIERA